MVQRIKNMLYIWVLKQLGQVLGLTNRCETTLGNRLRCNYEKDIL